jgi:hypothetical protein
MTPTNHLRWLKVVNRGIISDVLQQFWEDEHLFTTMGKDTPTWDEKLQKFGEWRNISVEYDR